MRTAEQPPLLVLGMHRSGTSLLANLLHASGISMGRAFVEGSGGNPAGLYEDVRFVEWHERVLASESGGEWPLCGMRWLRRHPVEGAAWDVAGREAAVPGAWTDGPWGWKDPRTLLFLAQWMDRYPLLRGVVLVRHPGDVYQSFLRRGDLAVALDPLLAFETYASYYEAALPVIEARPEAFQLVGSDDLMRDWDETAARLQEWLGLPLQARTVRPRRAAFHPSASDDRSEALLERLCPRAIYAYRRLRALLEGRAFSAEPQAKAVPAEPVDAALLAYEASLPDGGAWARRRLQLRVELGQSLDVIGEGGHFFEAKMRYYDEQISRLRESERILGEQKAHLEKQVAFMRENAGVEAWRARRTIMEMRQTVSWRVTAPLRRLRGLWGGGPQSDKEAKG